MTREEAVELLSNDAFKLCIVQLRDPLYEACYEALEMAIEALQQEPKRGKWLDDNNSFNSFYANCSECGYQMDKHEERGYHNYCPNCGARMESDEE